jgi:hypothetical protein
MFNKLGKRQKEVDFQDELEYLSQLDEYNEIDFENIEIKKHQPNKKNTDIDYSNILSDVKEFKNRKIYKKLDLTILNSIEDKQLVQVIFDNLTAKIEPDYENEFEIIKSFNIHKQMIYSIWVFTTEIDNGGLLQFYENSSGKFYKLALESLKTVKANDHFDVLKKANNYIESIDYKFAKIRHWINSSFEFTKLNNLDNQYFETSAKEDLEKLQIEYIRENIEYFAD